MILLQGCYFDRLTSNHQATYFSKKLTIKSPTKEWKFRFKRAELVSEGLSSKVIGSGKNTHFGNYGMDRVYNGFERRPIMEI